MIKTREGFIDDDFRSAFLNGFSGGISASEENGFDIF